MPGKRRARKSAPSAVASSQTCSSPVAREVGGDGRGDDVARGEVGQRVRADHDPPSRPVDEHGALAADRLGDQRLLALGARAGPQHGRVELHHLDVGDLGAGPQGEGETVAGRAGRGGGGRVDLAVPAGGQDDGPRAELAVLDQGAAVDAGDPEADDRGRPRCAAPRGRRCARAPRCRGRAARRPACG